MRVSEGDPLCAKVLPAPWLLQCPPAPWPIFEVLNLLFSLPLTSLPSFETVAAEFVAGAVGGQTAAATAVLCKHGRGGTGYLAVINGVGLQLRKGWEPLVYIKERHYR